MKTLADIGMVATLIVLVIAPRLVDLYMSRKDQETIQ